MRDIIDKTSERAGTPINRDLLMAIQGFEAQTLVADESGNTFIATNSKGETLTTTFADDGTIVEVFVGEKTITKTTTIEVGQIREAIS